MHKMGTISVGTFNHLEPGDLFAYEFLGHVKSGTIIAVVHFPFQLTDDQRKYLEAKKIEIPENENATIGGSFEGLYFYQHGYNQDHMFVDGRKLVAIFPNPRGPHQSGRLALPKER